MAKLSAVPRSVNPSHSSVTLSIRRVVNARARCPWCGAPMYLSMAGDRLLCVDTIHCAGVQPAVRALQEAHKRLVAGKEVA